MEGGSSKNEAPLAPDVPTSTDVHITLTLTDLKKRFTYHKPDDSKMRGGLAQQSRYELLREQALALATSILHLTPKSREQSLAFTKLEEAIMWANSAIARRE